MTVAGPGSAATPHHGAAPGAAPPPPGPGVRPPFIAPPTDGTRQRRGWAVTLAVLAAVLCCAGGAAGFGALVVFGNQKVIDEARSTVTDYLSAIEDGDFDSAYELLCPRERARRGRAEFTLDESHPGLSSFEVGDPSLAAEVTVPAALRFDDGTAADERFVLDQDSSTGELKVCGTAR